MDEPIYLLAPPDVPEPVVPEPVPEPEPELPEFPEPEPDPEPVPDDPVSFRLGLQPATTSTATNRNNARFIYLPLQDAASLPQWRAARWIRAYMVWSGNGWLGPMSRDHSARTPKLGSTPAPGVAGRTPAASLRRAAPRAGAHPCYFGVQVQRCNAVISSFSLSITPCIVLSPLVAAVVATPFTLLAVPETATSRAAFKAFAVISPAGPGSP